MRAIKYCVVLFVCAMLGWANFSSPPNGRTGAPGETTCAQVGCHSSPSNDITGDIGITGLPETLTPNETYNLLISLTPLSGAPVFGGFEMTVLNDQEEFTGAFTETDDNTTLSSTTGRTYVKHSTAKRFDGSNPLTYTVDWTSPSELTTTAITFYIASNFANGNGTNSGDHITTANLTIDIPEFTDEDGDGFDSSVDCDDSDASINPDATEIPNNNVDENCDGEILIIDEDNDGFNSDEDCDDTDPFINPDATEIPNNNVDENCDGEILIIDEDNDGFNSDEDCDDTDPLINPGATEIPNNEVDEDCDGTAQVVDEDNDGFNSDEDCDDTDPLINPGATEIPNNEVDEDCDGTVSVTGDSATVTLQISTSEGVPFTGVLVDISGAINMQITSDMNGQLTVPLPADSSTVTLTFSREDSANRGLSALDIVIMRRHILGLALIEDPLLLQAADTNNNGSVSVIDIVQVRNVLLGFWESFPNRPTWNFEPTSIDLSMENAGQSVQIQAFKTGDVNASATNQ